jgi:methionine-rich copper-binding protein CopC
MRTQALRRWLPRTVFGAVIVTALAVSATPASAHNSLLGSTPAAGSVVTEQPGTFSVTTNDDLLLLGGEARGMALQVSGPASSTVPLFYGDGCVTASGPTLSADLQLGEPGEYTVTWQVVSIDGHPVSDQFTFDWQPAAGQPLAEGSPTAPTCGEPAAASPSPDDGEPAGEVPPATDGAFADALWIGGAAVAVLLAAAATFVIIIRRRPFGPPD